MALPYYMPRSMPFGTGIPTTSLQQLNQIYQHHNIQTMTFLQGMQYPPPSHVGYNFTPIPFKPYHTAPINSFSKPQNSLNGLPFSHTDTVPKMIYPVTPMPLRPIPFAVSTTSYQFQLRQVAKRVASSDARVEAESKRLKISEPKLNNFDTKGDKFAYENSHPLIVIPDDDEQADIKNPLSLSGSRMNPLFVGQRAVIGNDLSINPDPIYPQQLLLKPGPGQQYISKIRALVEGVSGNNDKKLNPPSVKNLKKEKKVRQKSKTKESTKSKEKRKISENANAIHTKIIQSNWHPNPRSYANDHVMLGANGTFISKSFYDTIPWNSFSKSTRILIGHYFNNYTLATQSLDGNNRLNMNIIEDIINHVMERCNVGGDSIRDIISSICADEALRRRRT